MLSSVRTEAPLVLNAIGSLTSWIVGQRDLIRQAFPPSPPFCIADGEHTRPLHLGPPGDRACSPASAASPPPCSPSSPRRAPSTSPRTRHGTPRAFTVVSRRGTRRACQCGWGGPRRTISPSSSYSARGGTRHLRRRPGERQHDRSHGRRRHAPSRRADERPDPVRLLPTVSAAIFFLSHLNDMDAPAD